MGLPTEVSNVHGAWHSPNTLHTMVRGSVFLITIWKSPRQIWRCAGHLCGWSHGNRNWQDWNPTLEAMNTVVNQTIIRSRPRQTRYPLVITTLHVSFFLNLHKGSDHVLIMAFFINHLWTFILRYDNTTFVLHTDNCPCLVLFTIKNVDI